MIESLKPSGMAESSSLLPSSDKPVIVRVKRKISQSALDAFCKYSCFDFVVSFVLCELNSIFLELGLEIHERPSKRPLIDFEKLSISDASSSTGMSNLLLHRCWLYVFLLSLNLYFPPPFCIFPC